MEYHSVANPVWTDASHSMISVQIVFPSISQSPLKFVASPNDVMDYGRAIYADLTAGKYGVIAEATQ